MWHNHLKNNLKEVLLLSVAKKCISFRDQSFTLVYFLNFFFQNTPSIIPHCLPASSQACVHLQTPFSPHNLHNGYFQELIETSEIRLCCIFVERFHAQELFKENMQEASAKGFQIPVILPMECFRSGSVFLVILLFTLQCPAVPEQFVAADITKMGKVCELDTCNNSMKVKRKVIYI